MRSIDRGAGGGGVRFDEAAHRCFVRRTCLEAFEADHVAVHLRRELAVFVEDVRDTGTHACGEVSAGVSKDNHDAAGHVLAAVVAHALDHRVRAGVAHGKALAADATEKRLAFDGAVEHDVAGDDVLGRLAAELG